jgi:dimethylaniline monooxygenase (N-oxide forming)
LLKEDPPIAWQYLFGPTTPYQYRLVGPGKWSGARDAIMTVMDRVRSPLATRPLPVQSDKDRVMGFITKIITLFVVLVLLKLIFV